VGYTSPVQSEIMEELGLSTAEVYMYSSLLSIHCPFSDLQLAAESVEFEIMNWYGD